MEAFADVLYALPKKYSYVFDLVHFVLCIQKERGDLTQDELESLGNKHPFSLWLSSMMVCFAGGILVGPLAGEAALDGFNDGYKILIATMVWYFLFYVNPAYELSNRFAAKLPLYVIKGLYYPKKILDGIKFAKSELKRNSLALYLIPVLKGNGSGFITPFARCIRNSSRGYLGSETLSPSTTTKYIFIATVINIHFFGDISYILTTGLLLAMKVAPLFQFNVAKPFELVNEKVMSKIFRVERPALKEDKTD